MMKRKDAFLLGLTTCVAANCVSYFVRSEAPYTTGWGRRPGYHDLLEEIGFPFLMYSLPDVGLLRQWIGALGNAIVAVAASYWISRWLARWLPAHWPDRSRAANFSGPEFATVAVIAGTLLGVAMMSPSAGLLARNLFCLGGPLCVYAWLLYRQRTTWPSVTIAAICLTIATLAIDLRYQDPPTDLHSIAKAILPRSAPGPNADFGERLADTELYITRKTLAISAVRSVVPVCGLFSSMLILDVAYQVVLARYGGVRSLFTKILRALRETRYENPGGRDEGADDPEGSQEAR